MLVRLERYQAALLLILPLVWCAIVFSPSFATDPDSFFHVGVARRMLEDGWLRTFDALPYSTLHDPYPDMYLAQHVVLMPLVALFGPHDALRVGVVLLSSGFAVSLYLVLRRRGVRWPAPWIVLALLACPLALTYAVFLKGATSFFILLPWFIDAVWAGARRRTFVLAWLSVYVYVGATVLLPFAIVHLLAVRWLEQRWDAGCVVATIAGVIAGMIVHPCWPAHWGYVAAELATIFERDPTLVPGEYRGLEWAIVDGLQLVQMAGVALAAWAVILVRQLGRASAMTAPAVSGTVAALGLLGAGLLSGTKMVQIFLVISILTVPQLAELMRPWPRLARAGAVVLAIAAALWSIDRFRDELADTPGLVRPRDYQVMASWLDERTGPREMVVAPWDDMPGLFLFGGDQRYMAGVNVQFLRDHDRRRFEAYALFYRGVINDPEKTMEMFFDGARFVLVRRVPHFPGEPALTAGLAANPAFEELAGPTPAWRVFRRRVRAPP